ncbi:MAG: 50S ribosomal protein L10 [Deltaproteobacteria bacterium]|uniref:Large ribosomal subunit protein uL10 n=1 Tax=Candidatus Zymogenus saltonus TaxID=2844893 RepID=A0A9D8PNA8_9DELT|nr:50S ribosomal protein L10 [Candidatus Zymogenus saltonus]
MKREKKEALVVEMHKRLSDSNMAFLTDYRGLSAEEMNELRNGFRNVGIEYKVVKNKLIILAAKDTDFASMVEDLVGPTGIIVSNEDPAVTSKVLAEFIGKFKNFEFKKGLLRGKEISEANVISMSKLPSRDVLIAMLLGTMNAVPTGLVQVLSGIKRKFVYALVAIKDAKETAN